MNGQHLRALPTEKLAPKIGDALVEAGICKDATGEFVTGTGVLLQGSLELIADVVPQVEDVMNYQVRERRPCFRSVLREDTQAQPRCPVVCKYAKAEL